MSQIKSNSIKSKHKRYFEENNEEAAPVSSSSKLHKSKKPYECDVIEIVEKSRPIRKHQIDKKLWHKNGKLRINPMALAKHSRGPQQNPNGVKTKFFKEKLLRKENVLKYAAEQAVRTEILRVEDEGFIEPDDNECTAEYTQEQIVANVDITAATKHFQLNLDFGPYRMRYTRNGRHLLIGGKMGHVAAFDWMTKRLHCEMNVTEQVFDVAWLHIETMFAVAQKQWVHVYDNQGTELHCIKKLNRVQHLEFLPYHFLLATGSDEGYLGWLDISIGQLVANYNSRLGPVQMMCQNPSNGVLCIGGSKGVVSMWSPAVRQPLAKLLCHSTPMSAITCDPQQGHHLITSGLDKMVKIWDLRKLDNDKPLFEYKLRMPANELQMSQKQLLAIGMGNVCEIYRKPNVLSVVRPYLRQRCGDYIHGMQFCPYEDVLGVSTAKGFQSLLVPGSGEPNFDAIEANPYQSKSQRREYEVHALLDKIPMEFIALDSNAIAGLDVPTLAEKIDAKQKLLHLKAPSIKFDRRKKMKGKSGSANAAKAKRIVKEQAKKDFVNEIRGEKKKIFDEHRQKSENFIPLESGLKKVLKRFKPSSKRK